MQDGTKDDPGDVVRRWIARAWRADEVPRLAELIHSDHPVGARSVMAGFHRLHAQLDSVEVAVDHQVAEDDRVATFLSVRGALDGDRVEWRAAYLHTIRDGRIADVHLVSGAPDLS